MFRRHVVFVVVEHGFVIARRFCINLIEETLRFGLRIVQLAETIADSRPPIKNSKRFRQIFGFTSLRRASGDTSTGYSVMKVG